MSARPDLRALSDEKAVIERQIVETELELDSLAALLEGLRERRAELRRRMTDRVMDLPLVKAVSALEEAGALDDGILDSEVIS